MGFASGVPFISPIVTDATREPDALVPDRFRKVQWTRLPGGDVSPEVLARFLKLWSHRTGALAHDAANVGPAAGRAISAQAPGQRPGLPPKVGRALRARLVMGAAVAVLAIVAFLIWPRRNPPTPIEATAARRSAPPTAANPTASAISAKPIAVLPFENRSAAQENAFFTDGIHDDILTHLTRISALHVISRTSVTEHRGTTKKLPQIARELGVAFVLKGSVQRPGTSVRITGQLIRAATDQHVWADNYDRELTAANVFAIQSALAKAIAGELKAALLPQEKTH